MIIEYNSVEEADGVGQEEVNEFIENIEAPSFFEFNKKKVINHLKHTRYIVAIQIPTSDADDYALDVAQQVITYMVDKYNGMQHVDNEGFYQNGKIILEE